MTDTVPRRRCSDFFGKVVLRGFIALVLVSLLYGAIGVYLSYQHYQYEQRIVDHIYSEGGLAFRKFFGPKWIPESVQMKLWTFHRIYEVSFIVSRDKPHALQNVLPELASLRRLRTLNVQKQKLDSDPKQLQELKGLTSLMLHSCVIKDADFVYLEPLANLTWLDLSGTDIGDQAVAHLAKLGSLEILDLSESLITDRGMVHVEHLTNLRYLNLSETAILDTGVVGMVSLTKLEQLDLSGTGITNVGLKSVAKCSQIHELDLSYTRINDDGLEYLTELKDLRSIRVHETDTTPEGHLKLQSAFPNCEVVP